MQCAAQRLQQCSAVLLSSRLAQQGCFGKQITAAASLQLQAKQPFQQHNTCICAVQAHFSSSSSSSSWQQQGSNVLQTHAPWLPHAAPSPAAAAAVPAARARWLHPAFATLQPFSSSSSSRPINTSAAAHNSRKPQQQQQQARKMAEVDFKAVTLDGVVVDQYSHPVSYMQSGAFPHPKKTWDFFWANMRAKISGYMARRTAAANIPGFTKAGLQEEAAAIYLRVQEAQAQMQPDLARDVVAKSVFNKLRTQTEQRRKQGWARVEWELLDADNLHKNIKYIQARGVKVINESPFDWIQYTFCISSKQRFAAYGTNKALLAGNPDEVLDVTEYCVFERKTKSKVKLTAGSRLAGVTAVADTALEGSRWRLVAWLDP